DLVQIQMCVADRRGQNVDPARTGIHVDRLVNPRAGTHSPNARAPGRKRHIGCPHRLIADVNSLVRLELSPAPTGIGKWRPDPPPEAGAGLSAVKTNYQARGPQTRHDEYVHAGRLQHPTDADGIAGQARAVSTVAAHSTP